MGDQAVDTQSLRAALEQRIQTLQANPSMSRAVFRVDTRLVDTLLCQAQIRDLPPVLVDEPPAMGGSNRGPTPVEMVLVALGTCQEIMYAVYAQLMGLQLDAVEVKLKGYLNLQGLFGLAEGVPPGMTRVEYQVILASPEPEDRLQQLVRAVDTHCPVLDILTRPVEVKGDVVFQRRGRRGEG
ncbi:MAG: OsmC family protein [Anaerolineae bacterium]